MSREELEEQEYQYYVKQVDMENTVIELKNATMFLETSKEILKQNYKINDSLEDDGKVTEIIEKIKALENFINNNVISGIEQERLNKNQEIQLAEI